MGVKEFRLQRNDLGEGWIDLSYGEPVIIKSIFDKYTSTAMRGMVLPSQKELLNVPYPNPKGINELTSFLEEKYGDSVVISNGAKHGLMAVMHAIKKQGISECAMHSPYWVSIPPIIESQGLTVNMFNISDSVSAGACLVTVPNNPDGNSISNEELVEISNMAKETGVILVHDAAYYSTIYVDSTIKPVADVTIYSFSKMWGLSGLRVGYVVVKNKKLLPDIVNFIEQSCSGVSVTSQLIALSVESFFKENPDILHKFNTECHQAIANSRKELQKISSDILEVQPCNSNSMFAWCKGGPKLNNVKAKVNISDGSGFGKPGFYRINLAVDTEIIKSAVERLNSAAEEV